MATGKKANFSAKQLRVMRLLRDEGLTFTAIGMRFGVCEHTVRVAILGSYKKKSLTSYRKETQAPTH
jgi:DNA-binding NarL/FixJ family response regulator